MRDAADDTRRGYPGNRGPRFTPGSAPLNERPYRLMPAPGGVAGTGSGPVDPDPADDEAPGYVIHLPVRVTDLTTATGLACAVAESLGFLSELDAGETTVSSIDDQSNQHRVFCDLLLPDRSRCPQRFNHRGPCGQPPRAPSRCPEPRPPCGP